jgi:glutamate synthase domain-containing protein 2
MKTVPLVLALTACQSVAAPAEAEAACQVTVRFGSYAMGIDSGAAAAIDALLAGSPDVRGVTRTGAGREGEYVLCVRTSNTAAASRLMASMRPLLPAKPRGPISVEGPNGRIDAPAR